jgi:hypothetical protein
MQLTHPRSRRESIRSTSAFTAAGGSSQTAARRAPIATPSRSWGIPTELELPSQEEHPGEERAPGTPRPSFAELLPQGRRVVPYLTRRSRQRVGIRARRTTVTRRAVLAPFRLFQIG